MYNGQNWCDVTVPSLKNLPKKRVYCPPLNIRIVDHRAFGRKPVVGLHCISSIDEHRVDEETLANFRPPLPCEYMCNIRYWLHYDCKCPVAVWW